MVQKLENVELAGTTAVTGTMSLPSGSVKDGSVSSDANDRISGSKVKQQYMVRVLQSDGGLSSTLDEIFYRATSAGTIKSIRFSVETAPTSTIVHTIDILKAADGSGSFSSIITAITINSSTTIQTATAVTVGTSSYSADDRFKVDVSTTGSGTNTSDILIEMLVEENPS